MKKLHSLLLATLVMLAGCGEINDRLDNLEGRVDAIENSKITTIEQQIVAINTTLSTLVTADSNLKDYIISLQEQATELEASIATTNQKIDQMKESLEGEIDANVAAVDSNGIVTAKAKGSTTITAKAGDISATCAITVSEAVQTIFEVKNQNNQQEKEM